MFFIIICFFKLFDFSFIPPKKIPTRYLSQFLLNGSTLLKERYINGVLNMSSTPEFSDKKLKLCLRKIKNRQHVTYSGDTVLHSIFAEYPNIVKNKSVIIPGSQYPGFEAYSLHFGAKRILTIDYQTINITSSIKKLKFMLASEFWSNPEKFDLGISFSNFEHDGLGRYGDPINPFGDALAMRKMRKAIKCNGYFIVAVPYQNNEDILYWNAHRIYGKARLPILLKDWKVIKTWGKHPGGAHHVSFLLQNIC
jgi:hypothetical protein